MNIASLSSAELVALVVATSFAAGLNVSATVATIGLLAHSGSIVLPSELQIVSSWWVIGAALAMFTVEFVLDKIPGVDLVWNALQTFVRVPAGAVLAYGATTQLSLGHQLLAAALGAVVALAAHAGKAAIRTSVTLSPEPFSNALVGLTEDAVAISLTWFATRHPFIAAGMAAAFLMAVVLLLRVVWRALLSLFQPVRQGSRPA